MKIKLQLCSLKRLKDMLNGTLHPSSRIRRNALRMSGTAAAGLNAEGKDQSR
jgi:hypothetical protein